jgi:hypothetical protein
MLNGLSARTELSCRKHSRSFIANPGERVTNVATTDDNLIIELADRRTISVPLAWYPRLFHTSQDDRDHWEVAGAGFGIHWPAIDEDLSVEGLLRGAPAPRVRVVSS